VTSIDDVLYDFIRDKIQEIVSDTSILDKIFEDKSVQRLEQIKQFLLSNDIRVVYHHPRDASEIPCYAIILEGSNESEQVIGSSGGQYDAILLSNMDDGWIASDSDILATTILPSGEITGIVHPVDVKQFYSAIESKDGHRSCHVRASKGSSIGKGIWIDLKNSVLLGGSVSLVGMDYVSFLVKSNHIGSFLEFGFGQNGHREQTFPFTITTKNVWERINVRISGVPSEERSAIRYMSFMVTNDDQYSDVFITSLKGQLALGSVMDEVFLDHNYRVESWSNNAELTLIMYSILLWNILKYRVYFERSWGLLEQRVEGGDIMPQPEFYPEFVYIRGLSYTCKTIEVIPREEDLTEFDIRVGRTDFGQGTEIGV